MFNTQISNKNKSLFKSLTFYREMLINAKISYRISPSEMALSSLKHMQKLHDEELERVRNILSPSPKHISVSNEIDFEQALESVLV